MSHFHVDGTITIAKLKRPLLGGAVYTDVIVRQDDGDQRRVGALMAHRDMRQAMVPGARGRFYFHNVLGSKGIHGFRAAGGQSLASFPGRWAGIFLSLGALNVALVAFWLMVGERIGWVTFGMGLACLILAGIYGVAGSAAMRAYRADAPHGAPSGKLRAAAVRA